MNTQTNETLTYAARGEGRGQTPVKAKRQKQVFPTERIAHLWAHKTQDSARNQGGNFYFDRAVIYSYGSHFPIARHVVTPAGVPVVLFTNRTYSVTTAKHLNLVSRAIPPGVPVFRVENPKDDFDDSLRELKRTAETKRAELDGAGNRKSTISKAWRALQHCDTQARNFAYAFGLGYISQLPDNAGHFETIATTYELKLQSTREARESARYARNEVERAEWARLEAMKLEERIDAWRAGVDFPWHFRFSGACLLRVKDNEVQTTMGAVVPVEHVRKAFPLVLALIRGGRTYQRNGHTIHLGHYALDSIDAEGTVRAGCHTILRPEVERLAETLGLGAVQQ